MSSCDAEDDVGALMADVVLALVLFLCNVAYKNLVLQDQRTNGALFVGAHSFIVSSVHPEDVSKSGYNESLCFKCVSEALVFKVCVVVGLVRKQVMRMCFMAIISGC